MRTIALECYEPYKTNPGGNIPQYSSFMVTDFPSLKLFKSDEQDMQDTAGEIRAISLAAFSSGLSHTHEQELDVRLEPVNNSSVQTRDVV